ncbi:MAG: hypothetical protein FWD27_02815 [Coriobacteriia bacterium]|nr:hypothetical protein [Coriobacteriia bacterium]
MTLKKPREKEKPKRRRVVVFKGIGTGFVFLALSLSAILASLLPVPTLPTPTGNYAVGVQHLHLVDENRNNSFFTGSLDKRELMVKIYYPAEDEASQPFVHYFRGSKELAGAYLKENGFPGAFFQQLAYAQTHSKENLQLARQHSSYPVILFSHGWGFSIELYTSLCEGLASHGYIVIAIDHTYLNGASLLPDRIVRTSEAPIFSGSLLPETLRGMAQTMTDDSIFVIDVLEKLDSGNRDSIFRNRLDLDNIGIAGHSLGGAASYNLAINDSRIPSRINAAINLDGDPLFTPEPNAELAPILMLTNGENWVVNPDILMPKLEDMPEEYYALILEDFGAEAVYNAERQREAQVIRELSVILADSQTLFFIKGSLHSAYSDLGFCLGKPLEQLFGIGTTGPAKTLEITQALMLAYFDQHLKGQPGSSLDTLVETYSELQRVKL